MKATVYTYIIRSGPNCWSLHCDLYSPTLWISARFCFVFKLIPYFISHNWKKYVTTKLQIQFEKDCSKSIPYSGFLSCEWKARLTAGDKKDNR
jgi:hypothetical protein